jgi:two-component system chemotaxis response regulator CheY
MYSIGEISKLVKITSETLRHYDEIQLLNPDYINPSNNYRFYSEEQVKDILYIMDLKECGFSLEEIKTILKLKDKTKIQKLFTKKEAELINQSEKINSSIERIRNKLKIMERRDMKENIKILFVDDAAFFRNIMIDVLQKNGYEKCSFIQAADGLEAVERYKEHKPDITLMDIKMPNMDGITAVKEIKKIDDNAKIIIVSAMKFHEYFADSLIAGAVDFISKPCQGETVVEVISKHLSEDVEFDIEKIKSWREERLNFYQQAEEQADKLIEKEKLLEKLPELIKSCVTLADEHQNYDDLIATLITTIKGHLVPALNNDNRTLNQNRIDTQIRKFIKV